MEALLRPERPSKETDAAVVLFFKKDLLFVFMFSCRYFLATFSLSWEKDQFTGGVGPGGVFGVEGEQGAAGFARHEV